MSKRKTLPKGHVGIRRNDGTVLFSAKAAILDDAITRKLADKERRIETSFRNADLTRVRFFDYKFQNVDFTDATFYYTKFIGCTFNRCIFQTPNYRDERISGNLAFRDCRFIGGTLANTDFTGAQFKRCIFESVHLEGSTFQFFAFDDCRIRDSFGAYIIRHEDILIKHAGEPIYIPSRYDIRMYRTHMVIGCQAHSYYAWENATPAIIKDMDEGDALAFWYRQNMRTALLAIARANAFDFAPQASDGPPELREAWRAVRGLDIEPGVLLNDEDNGEDYEL